MTEKERQLKKLLKKYEGKDLTKIGKFLEGKSSYNCLYYKLPNGIEVRVKFYDDENYADTHFFFDGAWIVLGEIEIWCDIDSREHREFHLDYHT